MMGKAVIYQGPLIPIPSLLEPPRDGVGGFIKLATFRPLLKREDLDKE